MKITAKKAQHYDKMARSIMLDSDTILTQAISDKAQAAFEALEDLADEFNVYMEAGQ